MVKSKLGLGLLAVLFLATVQAAEQRQRENEYYQIVTLPTPDGIQFEAGQLLFRPPDTLYCTTRLGDIWKGTGVLSVPAKVTWKRVASGLHEVLGISWREGWLYVTQRGEVSRLKDSNGDDRADIVETYCDAWGISGDYHEYAFGSRFDPQGNMYVVLCLTGSFTSDSPYRGWCLKIGPDGKAVPYCTGLRSPGGIGYNADGDLFYTDNQGPWNGACKLQQLKQGAFVGHPGGIRWFDMPTTREAIAAAGLPKPAQPKSGSRLYEEAKRIPELLPPAVYFPYNKMGQSASGIACDLSNGKFGPFARQLFVGDQTHSTVMRVFLEKVNDRYQGVCFPFREGFDSGSLGLEFASDSTLFVYGTDRGWGARGGKPFALQRLIWTGRNPFEIHEMRARPDGFEFEFTQPVDPKSATALESWKIETFALIYQSEYGSPEVDRTHPTVRQAVVSADNKTVRLVIDGLVEGHIHEMHFPGIRSSQGEPLLHDAAYYTLNAIPRP